ncbi:MAG: hypothetical protein ACJA07_000431 [Rhodococcus sp. (in: high G+C Gram-positive bacteria)]|jgi:hypothetical protein
MTQIEGDFEVARARLVVTIEYDVDLTNYPGAVTAQDAAALDAENLERATVGVEHFLCIAESIEYAVGS